MGDLRPSDFQTTDQCNYVYRLYRKCIESRRGPIWLNRQSAEADPSENFSNCTEMKQKTMSTCGRMQSVPYSRIVDWRARRKADK